MATAAGAAHEQFNFLLERGFVEVQVSDSLAAISLIADGSVFLLISWMVSFVVATANCLASATLIFGIPSVFSDYHFAFAPEVQIIFETVIVAATDFATAFAEPDVPRFTLD